MKKIINYKIISANYVETQVDTVNNSIKNGWQPYGNLTVLYIDGETPNHRYAQPMVKYEEDHKIVIDESKVIKKNPIMISENEELPKGFKIYKCTDCQTDNLLRDNGEITVGHCNKCEHPLWND